MALRWTEEKHVLIQENLQRIHPNKPYEFKYIVLRNTYLDPRLSYQSKLAILKQTEKTCFETGQCSTAQTNLTFLKQMVFVSVWLVLLYSELLNFQLRFISQYYIVLQKSLEKWFFIEYENNLFRRWRDWKFHFLRKPVP